MSIGPRIKQARYRRALSLRDLASKAGLSHNAIAKYEKGLMTPGSESLLRIAKALDADVDYFLRAVNVKSIAPAYRKRGAFRIKKQRQLVEDIRDWLERYLSLEYLMGPQIVKFEYPAGFPLQVGKRSSAEVASIEFRSAIRIGQDPIENLTQALEDIGIKIWQVDHDDGFDACAFVADIDESAPVIVLRRGVTGDRQRFSLAHELGHIMLDCSNDVHEEKVCNQFAASLLVPEASFLYDIGVHRKALDLDELQILKRKYKVSIQMLIRRALDLNVISKAHYVSWQKKFNVFGWRRNEPGKPICEEVPYRFELLARQAVSENIISKRRAEELLGQSVASDRAIVEPT